MNLDNSQKLVVSFTARQLYAKGKTTSVPWIGSRVVSEPVWRL